MLTWSLREYFRLFTSKYTQIHIEEPFLSIDADQTRGDRTAWQDIEWAEFARTEDVQITCLSEGGRQHQLEQRALAEQKGKQREGGGLFS